MLYDAAGKASPAWRYELFLLYVSFLAASGQPAALPPPADLQRWLRLWGSSQAERLRAYDACAQCAAKLPGGGEAQQWLLLLLRECEGAPPAELGAHAASAFSAVCAALRSPTEFQLDDLAALAAVKQLGGSADATHADAARLLAIFVSGGLADYAAFEKERPAALGALRLDPAAARRKMQLLTLVSLAHEAGGADLSFTRVAATCAVPDADVEELVIEAVAAGILDARMDETRAVLRVGQCLQRTFGAAEWKSLHAELGAWRATVQAAVEVVGSAPVAV